MSASTAVWSTFTKTLNGKELKLRIQELPMDKIEDLFDFLFKYFVAEEPLHKASKLAQRPEALEEYKQVFTMMAQEMGYQIDVCCLEESPGLDVVGVSVMLLEKKQDHCDDLEAVKAMVKSEEIKTLLTLSTYLDDLVNVFDKFDVDSCYKGRGIAVHRDYRGIGIAGELIKVRCTVSSKRGVLLTSAWMTAVGTQVAASRLAWETVFEQRYKDLGELLGVEFEEQPLFCKLMAIKT